MTSDGTYSYEYDGEGNRTKRTTIATGVYEEYAWDHRNRLTGITFKNASATVTKRAEYTYDVFDRRIAKKVDANADGTFEMIGRYVYDGDDIVLVFDGSGGLVARYLHGPGVDQVLAEETNAGAVRWALADHLGSVRDIADSAGNVLNHVAYDSFGQVLSQSSPAQSMRYQFSGREVDAESGLASLVLREYRMCRVVIARVGQAGSLTHSAVAHSSA